MRKLLIVNPGSTSTKIAVYEDEKQVWQTSIRHSVDELSAFQTIMDQFDFRKNIILEKLKENNISISDFAAVVGRGGLMRPLESGVYLVNEQMINDLKQAVGGEHASNLGAVLAQELALGSAGCLALIADPVVVDELRDVARISGLPRFPRRSTFHALNHKAIGRKYAASLGTSYEKLNLVIAHLGGGVSVAAHKAGRVVDTNQALDGFGPFSPERAGTMDAGAVVRACFAGEFTEKEILKLLAGRGGLIAHLGTNDVKAIMTRIEAGDAHAQLILEAFAYHVSKEIGAMLVALEGKTDAVILTGGIAYNQFVVGFINKMVSPLAHLVVYPGEDEMEALALSGLRVLDGEAPKLY